MDLRLPYGIAYGYPWFGTWGYRSCIGPFGINQHKYEDAVKQFTKFKLDVLIKRSNNDNIKVIIEYYRKLSSLITIRDLFQFMFSKKSNLNTYDDMSTLVIYFCKSNDFGFSLAAKLILQSKFFIKDWELREAEESDKLLYTCKCIPNGAEDTKKQIDEYIQLPLNATVGDFRAEGERAMRDTYCIMKNIKSIPISEEANEVPLLQTIGSLPEILMKGYGLDLSTKLQQEGDSDKRKVSCRCGAEYHDGEDMDQCVRCGTLKHILCNSSSKKDEICNICGGPAEKAKESKDSAAGKQKVKIVEPAKDKDDDDDDSEDDDSDEDGSSDGSIMDEDDSGSEDEEDDTPKKPSPTKKRGGPDSAIKTPASQKKAKLATLQKTDCKKSSGHVATPYPSKQAGKTPANKQSPKSGGSHSCGPCNKSFNSEGALASHTKAKHSTGK